jgi:cell division protein FtsL
MRPFAFFERRVRGFRVVEIGALAVLLVLVLTVYLAKTGAGGKSADIDHVQAQIDDEQSQIRLLRAEVASLEQPERLQALSDHYLGLVPISARHEITPEALMDIARVDAASQKPIAGATDPLTSPGSPDLTAGVKAADAAPAATKPPAPAPAAAPADDQAETR